MRIKADDAENGKSQLKSDNDKLKMKRTSSKDYVKPSTKLFISTPSVDTLVSPAVSLISSTSLVSQASPISSISQASPALFSPSYAGNLEPCSDKIETISNRNTARNRPVIDEFDPYLFIRMLPPLGPQFITGPCILPKKTRSSPNITLVF
jgi:hypothetical protein